MATPQQKIEELEALLNRYQQEYDDPSTTIEDKRAILKFMTASRQDITALRRQGDHIIFCFLFLFDHPSFY
jgi:hypothetical protein